MHEGAISLLPLPRADEAADMLFSQYVPCIDEKTSCELNYLGLSSCKMHICVSSPSKRRAQDKAHIHVCSIHLPPSSILRLSDHVYIVCPELLFLQKARETNFSLERLILLGYGLCGKFAIVSSNNKENILIQIKARSSVEKITAFLNVIEEMNRDCEHAPKGLSRARRALSYVVGSVESPAEARIAMLEFLPTRLGGEGVRAPECNGVVKLPEELMVATGRSSFRCDFLWREKNVVLEYNGTHHGESREVNRDAEKYNALNQAGYKVIIAARKHIADPAHTEALAEQLRNSLGQRVPRVKGDWDSRKMKLRHELGLNN